MTDHKSLILVGLIVLFAAVGTFPPVLAGQSAQSKTITQEDAEPFLTVMKKAMEATDRAAVNVKNHSNDLGNFNPENLSELYQFAAEWIEKTKTASNAKLVNRHFTTVNNRLGLCIGADFPEKETIRDLTVCQDVKSNLLSKVLVKDSSGNLIGKYLLKKAK